MNEGEEEPPTIKSCEKKHEEKRGDLPIQLRKGKAAEVEEPKRG